MTNDAEYRKAFDLVWAQRPSGPAYPERTQRWLLKVAEKASLMRAWPLAEAALRELTERYPNAGALWSQLASAVGRQGRFQEAVVLAQTSLDRPGHFDPQSKTIKAMWLWQLGRRDEAKTLMEWTTKPTAPSARGDQMMLAAEAYFAAVAERDPDKLQKLVRDLVSRPGSANWCDTLKRDPCFDAVRLQPWFVAAVGVTAEGTAPDSPFPVPADAQDLQALVSLIPHDTKAAAARKLLAEAYAQLSQQRWDEALASALLGEEAEVPLTEFFMVHCLALIGKNAVPAAMSALHELDHRGYRLDDQFFDGQPLLLLTQGMVDRTIYNGLLGDDSSGQWGAAEVVRGMMMVQLHMYDDVMAEMNVALSYDGHNPDLFALRGQCWLARRHFAKAEQDFRKALSVDRQSVTALRCLAAVRSWREQHDEALQLMDQAIAIDTSNPALAMVQVRLLIDAGHVDQGLAALTSLRTALPLPPRLFDDGSASAALGCDLQGRFAEGEAVLRQGIAFAPHRSDLQLLLSLNLARQGKYQEALLATDRALILGDPSDPGANILRAAWLARLGKADQAQMIMDQVRAPEVAEESEWDHLAATVFAAQTGEEELLEEELRRLFAHHDDNPVSPLVWISHEIFFDPFRDRPWFVKMMEDGQAEFDRAAAAAFPPRLPGDGVGDVF